MKYIVKCPKGKHLKHTTVGDSKHTLDFVETETCCQAETTDAEIIARLGNEFTVEEIKK